MALYNDRGRNDDTGKQAFAVTSKKRIGGIIVVEGEFGGIEGRRGDYDLFFYGAKVTYFPSGKKKGEGNGHVIAENVEEYRFPESDLVSFALKEEE